MVCLIPTRPRCKYGVVAMRWSKHAMSGLVTRTSAQAQGDIGHIRCGLAYLARWPVPGLVDGMLS
jgi:hypothetical protein